MIVPKLAHRLLFEPAPRPSWRFFQGMALQGGWAMRRFRRRARRGLFFPPFLFVSVTNRCELACQGCWVGGAPPHDMPPAQLRGLLDDAQKHGTRVLGIMGGEPLLYDELFETLETFRKGYILLFTNGLGLNDEVARRMRRLGNVSPIVSIEGREKVGDARRGGQDIWRRVREGIAACRRQGLVIGAATSVCKTNLPEVATQAFVDEMLDWGVHHLWYYIYRPVGLQPCPELALEREDIHRLRRFLVDTRTRSPMLIIDAYWDENGRALCPAVTGISAHVNPWGAVEPCPPIQAADTRIAADGAAWEAITESVILRRFRNEVGSVTRGCVLLEAPDLLRERLTSAPVEDSSGRSDNQAAWAAMSPRCGHDMGEARIPERHWLYRISKRYAFFGLGAYG